LRALTVLALLALSCAPRHAAAPTRPSPIRTDSERYVLRPGQHGHETRIIATFTAPEDSAAYIVNCGGAFSRGLQRLDGERWSDAWIPATNECLSPPIVVAPGGTLTDTLRVLSTEDVVSDPGPIRDRIEPGTYRVVWFNVLTAFEPMVGSFGPELALEQRVSGPITIERSP
jgi:hypothetical protein